MPDTAGTSGDNGDAVGEIDLIHGREFREVGSRFKARDRALLKRCGPSATFFSSHPLFDDGQKRPFPI
jgi:hypothetical protein